MKRSLGFLFVFGVLVAGCSPSGRRMTPGGGGEGDMGTGGTQGCQGLACDIKECKGLPKTTLVGKVTAPNGIDPVFDALVYVPTALPEFSPKVQCEVCNDPIGGTPIVSVHTAVDGTFTLTDVPANVQVPIVVQKGRFRKVTNLTINECTANQLSEEDARLPRKKSEGDLPKMAVAVGDYDQIECVLKSIGIDQSEFTSPSGNGSVHLYDNSAFGGGGNASLESLLADSNKLEEYNILFINCTGTQPSGFSSGAWDTNLYNYTAAGGRLYFTDWAYDYMEQVNQFAPYVFFEGGGSQTAPQPEGAARFAWSGDDVTGLIDEPNLLAWMKAAGAITGNSLNIIGTYALGNSVATDQAMYPSSTWVHGNVSGKDRPMTVTYDFNMCGKVLWSSYHTQEPGGSGSTFPTYCKSTAQTMIPQEKILEYLIFQLSSCVDPIG